ncbi:hypothetical protein BASA81_011307 [Batrachochytrium salamandrivorans]|nr:hypothetical protein BASA81_011307 [Batrachochytrium salamandrivorans]
MDTVTKVLHKPLRPLGVLFPSVTNEALQHLLWREIFVVVASTSEAREKLQVDRNCRTYSQSEIVDRLVSKSFDGGDKDNIFRYGHCQGNNDQGLEPKNSFGKYEVKYANWMVSYLKKTVWCALLDEIGATCMSQLLSSHQLFIKQNKCLIQLTGRAFFKLATLDKKPKPVAFAMRLSKFIKPKRAVSREQARLLALKIASVDSRHHHHQQAKPTNKRTRLERCWINAIPLLQRLLENHRKRPYNYLLKQAMASQTIQSDTEELLLGLKHREVPPQVVSRYVKSVLRRIVPKPFWGSPQTTRKLLGKVHHMWVTNPHPSAHDRFDLTDFAEIDLEAFAWLRNSPTTQRKKRQCFFQFVRFLLTGLARDVVTSKFLQLVSPQLQVAYYLNTAYTTHVVGEYLADNSQQFASMGPGNLDQVWKQMKDRKVGPVAPKFGLKKTRDRFRLIMNMRKQTKEFPKAANEHFKPAFYAINYELETSPELGGAFVQGMHQVYAKYLRFRRHHGNNSQLEFYCVVVDVEKCFDTMRQSLVYDLCESALRCEDYAVSTKSITFFDKSARGVRTKHLKICNPGDAQYANALEDPKLNTARAAFVATDRISRQFVTRSEALGLVSELLNETYVNFGKEVGLRKMRQGVPQGAVLSTLLCRLYYGQFEREVLAEFTCETDNLLMRYVDDFILFTPSALAAQRFRAKMELGNDKYNCRVNPSKLQMSGGPGQTHRWLPWCSLLFHTKTGEVRGNYSVRDLYSGTKIAARGLGPTLRSTARTKCHAILLDLEINSMQNVYCNLVQVMVLAATRFCKFVKYKRKLQGWVEVGDFFRFVHSLVQFKQTRAMVSVLDVECLGVLAFVQTLRRHQLQWLKLESKFLETVAHRRTRIGQHKIDWGRLERAAHMAAVYL